MSQMDRSRDRDEMVEEVINVRRCTKVVKGGRRFSFSALVTAGDQNGRVGLGLGKANVVAQAIQKGRGKAIMNLEKISLAHETIPHEIIGRASATRIKMMPARPGTGVIAGAVARSILECVGVTNILTKVYGNKNPMNVARATMDGLRSLRTQEQIEKLRGVKLS